MTDVKAGNKAPDFSLTGTDGKSYSLAALLRQGPAVVAFFKISCPVCQYTFPFLQRMFEQGGGPGVTFLGISQDDAKATKEFARKFQVKFPFALDNHGYPASNAYGLSMVPSIFLIGADRTVSVSSMGFVRGDLETIAGELAAARKISPGVLFRPEEHVPAQKPG